MKLFSVKRVLGFFVLILLISTAGFCAPQNPISEQDRQTILQQASVQPPENAKVNDVWLEPADKIMETKTVQASIGEYLRIVLVSPPAKNREWQYIDEKPRFLEKMHSQEIALHADKPDMELQTATLFIFKVKATASGEDRLTFVQYHNADGKKEAVSMLDLGVRYFSPEIRQPL